RRASGAGWAAATRHAGGAFGAAPRGDERRHEPRPRRRRGHRRPLPLARRPPLERRYQLHARRGRREGGRRIPHGLVRPAPPFVRAGDMSAAPHNPSSMPPAPPPSAPPDSSLTGIPASKLRGFARLWGFALFFVLLAYLFREVLLPFIFAVLIAYILAPYVTRLSRLHVGKRHLPRGAAVLICYAVLIAGMGVFFVAFLPRVTTDVAKLGAEAPRMWERMQNQWVPSIARFLDRHFPAMAAEPESAAPPALVTDLPPPPATALTVVPLA